MIAAIVSAESREDFVAAVRALDRVLLSGFYIVPLFHTVYQWDAHWTRIERTDAPYVYARRVMVNLNTSLWRRRRVALQLTGTLPERPDGPDAAAAVDLRDELLRACRTLPPRMRTVLVLRYFEDLPEAEVAAALGITVGAVKSQTSKALVKLRAVLGEQGLPTTATTNGSPA